MIGKPLGRRETQVLTLIGHGLSTKEIIARQQVSYHTVRSQILKIYTKLGICNRTQAMLYALRAGLVDLDDVQL